MVWEFEKDGEELRVDTPAVLVATSMDLEVAAAEAGIGIIGTFEEYVRPALDAGRLVSLLEPWCPRFSGPRLYYAGNRLMPAPLRAFVDFVKTARW